MRRRKKLFMFIAIVLVFMLSFVSIDTSAAGFLYSSGLGSGKQERMKMENGGGGLRAENGKSTPTDSDDIDNKDNTNKENTNKDNTNKENTNKENTNKENTNKENTNKENTNKENTNKENTNKENTNKENTNKENTNKDNTNKDNKLPTSQPGAPSGEYSNAPTGDNNDSNTSSNSSEAQGANKPKNKLKNEEGNTYQTEAKDKGWIDCINIKTNDDGTCVARIYFHMRGNCAKVNFVLNSSGDKTQLEYEEESEFQEKGFKSIDETHDEGIHYHFVIDAKKSLSSELSVIKEQLKDVSNYLGPKDSVSFYIVTGEGVNCKTEEELYSENTDKISEILDGIEFNSEETNIYNGLYEACTKIGSSRNVDDEFISRNVVVVISDGISEKNAITEDGIEISEEPVRDTLREYGLALYYIKLTENTEIVDGKSDYIKNEIDTEEPILYSEENNCLTELHDKLNENLYVTEVKFEDPKVAWPSFMIFLSEGETTEDEGIISKNRYFPQYLKYEEPDSNEKKREDETNISSPSSASSGNASPGGMETGTGSEDDGSKKSGVLDLLKDKWPIFVAVLLALLVIGIVIIIIAKKRQNDKQIELYMNKDREKKASNSSSVKNSSGSTSGTSSGSKGAYYINKGATTGVPLTIEINSGGALLTKLQARINGSAMLGRSDICDIVINNQNLSRQHLVIEYSDGEFYAQDLDSRNGTLFNGIRMTHKRRLEKGDKLSIGNLELVFRW